MARQGQVTHRMMGHPFEGSYESHLVRWPVTLGGGLRDRTRAASKTSLSTISDAAFRRSPKRDLVQRLPMRPCQRF